MSRLPTIIDTQASALPFPTPIRASESDHRIANHLAILTGSVRLKGAELQARYSDDSDAVSVFVGDICAQINAVSYLHRLLTVHDYRAPVRLAALLREICAPFAESLDGRVAIVEDFSPACIAALE